jgi:hypothetical protein
MRHGLTTPAALRMLRVGEGSGAEHVELVGAVEEGALGGSPTEAGVRHALVLDDDR